MLYQKLRAPCARLIDPALAFALGNVLLFVPLAGVALYISIAAVILIIVALLAAPLHPWLNKSGHAMAIIALSLAVVLGQAMLQQAYIQAGISFFYMVGGALLAARLYGIARPQGHVWLRVLLFPASWFVGGLTFIGLLAGGWSLLALPLSLLATVQIIRAEFSPRTEQNLRAPYLTLATVAGWSVLVSLWQFSQGSDASQLWQAGGQLCTLLGYMLIAAFEQRIYADKQAGK